MQVLEFMSSTPLARHDETKKVADLEESRSKAASMRASLEREIDVRNKGVVILIWPSVILFDKRALIKKNHGQPHSHAKKRD